MARACRLLAILFFITVSFAMAQKMPHGRLMRFPDVYKNRIVFSYAGDLWLAPTSGGIARRITTDLGLELFPKFSPDGKYIAFTAQYDGNSNVYVMPAEGGQPKQLTFHPGELNLPERMGVENEVITWFPDGKHILFLSRRQTFNDWFGQLFSVSIDGGLPVRLPIPKGGLTSFSPDGNQIAYNRIFRNFRTWKRYTGGMAQDIWLYNLKTNHVERITHYPGTDTFPMWHGGTIYFASDRGPNRRVNLYSYSLKNRQIRQLTHFTDFDVNWPSLGPDSIVFENGGYLYLFDLKTEKARKLTVYLPGDYVQARRHWVNVSKLVDAFDISPHGKRAVFTARGDVFTVPAKEGSIRNLTQTSGIRERYATWSPDGRWIAYMSDRTGEDELYIRPQDGGKEIRITFDGKMFRLPPVWSPDSKKLLFADKDLRLFYVDIEAKRPVLIDQGKYADLTDYAWSPDSQWVAYAKAAHNLNSAIYLYSLASHKITPVTTSFTDSEKPVFGPGGKYLFFLSNRSYNEVIGNYDFEFSNPKTTRVFLATLRADLPSPFAPRSDEEQTKKSEIKSNQKGAEGGRTAKAKTPFRIDLEGIQDRVVAVPMPPANIPQLAAAEGRIYYLTEPIEGLSGPLPGETSALHVYTLKDRKDHVLIRNVDGFALSFDGKKILYSAPKQPAAAEGAPQARTYGIINATPPEKGPHDVGDGKLDLADMRMDLGPEREWKQIFNEVWRQECDFFYEKTMNGIDWAKEREKYAPLLPYVKDRYDLNYVLGQMIGELSNSHTYVGGGDFPDLKPVKEGLLGVDFEADAAHHLYRFKKIYHGENWHPALRSPLTEPGVNVKEGEYLLAVNGHSLRMPQNPYQLFINTVGQNVTLTVNNRPDMRGAREVVVKPLSSELALRRLNWTETNLRKVEAATGGRVGYIYLSDMEGEGLNEFVKQFFPQIRKEGLIIDVRYNGGGFVDQLIFERLRRILAAMDASRNWGNQTIPGIVFHGYLACLTNHYTASDGDMFAYLFQHYKLGPVIGERTWGGVRGIRGFIPLIDGGYITRPEFALYNLHSQWVVENHGVEPDIKVDNRPDLVREGKDPQLEKAIDYLMNEIRRHPKRLPPRPPDLPAYPPAAQVR